MTISPPWAEDEASSFPFAVTEFAIAELVDEALPTARMRIDPPVVSKLLKADKTTSPSVSIVMFNGVALERILA